MTTPLVRDGRPAEVALRDERDLSRDIAQLLRWQVHAHLHGALALLERHCERQKIRISDLRARLRENSV